MARILYQFPGSTFSRRTLLALAHKGVEVDARDARSDDAVWEEAKKLSPQGTMPVLVDDGRVIGDSTAIAHYLDLAYEDRPRLWPRGARDGGEAIAITSLVDVAVNALAEMGTKHYPLRNDPAWPVILTERMRRAQYAIDEVAARATKPILAGTEWGAAEIWALSATLWIKGMPARASSSPLIAQILTLGFRLPDRLVAWAEPHESRPEVRQVYA